MLLGMLLLAGCSSKEQPEEVSAGDMCELQISLRMGALNENNSTRADNIWGENPAPEDGTDIENAISYVSLYMVSNDKVYPLTMVSQDVSDGEYQYKVKIALGVVHAESLGHQMYRLNGRLVAVVNHPQEVDFANPFAADLMDISEVREQNYIPMWGVRALENVIISANTTLHIGEIQLLRSIPKLTIMMDDEFRSLYKITEVKADRAVYRKYAHCEPKDANTVFNTTSILMEGGFNPAIDITSDLPVFKGLGTDETWCYLSETPLSLTNGIPESFTVTVARKDGTAAPFTGKVYLCDYSDGLPQYGSAFTSLVRNHDYRYKISLAELKFKVSVKDWIFGKKQHLQFE